MLVTNTITMAIDRQQVPPVIDAVQGEANSRAIKIQLTSGGQPWSVPSGASCLIHFGKPDKTGGTYDTLEDGTSAIEVGDNYLQIILAKQVLSFPGNVLLQIEMVSNEMSLMTFAIVVNVKENASAGTLESEDYINLSGYVASEVNRVFDKQGTAFLVDANLDYETGSASVSESAEAIYAAYEAKKACYMRATVTNSVPGAYQILVLQSAQKGNTGNGGTHYRLVFQTTSSVEIESEVAGGWITCLYLDEVVVSSFDGTAQNVCFHTQISPNANALTIGEQVYDGSVAVDMTDNINSMIDAKGRILLYEWAGINGGSFPAGNLTATDMVGEYSGVEVLFYCKRGGSLVSSGFIPKDTLYPNGAVAIGVTPNGELVTRTVKYSGNVFTFGSAMIGTGSDNAMLLPWRIYGYK